MALAAVLVLVSAGAVLRGKRSPAAPLPPTAEELRTTPHLVFVTTKSGVLFGRMAVVALNAPDAAPAMTDMRCDRVHFAAGHGVCLGEEPVDGHHAFFASTFDGALRPATRLPLPGPPSRTRVSPGGRYAAVTVFTTGESYACDFTTRTTLLDLQAGGTLGDLESFNVSRDGQPFRAADFNFWGVTFAADEDRFFATLASAHKTYLVAGQVSERTLRVLRDGVECPSLSPDGTRLAFKKRDGDRGWRLHVLDVRTLVDRPIEGERRSIDDQVEWLDDDHVLYGFVESTGLPEQASNIWVASVADGRPARIFVRSAASPAVVRATSAGASLR